VPTAPGKRLGHYELFERFAVGAMAELFLGRARGEEGFEKLVVIKRVMSSLAKDTRFVRMLQIEARIHASLSHKNIVQIHDLGVSADGEYFIVLEYVDGRDLGTLLDRVGKLPLAGGRSRVDDAVGLYIMGELAEGVHFAHELRGPDGKPVGLVHRDISPSNILLSYAGEVKLSDFGVAKRSSDSSLVNSLKGELGYISPEQARGNPVDRRSDIFSLGAVAFEIFTGNPLRQLTGVHDDYLQAASGIVASPLRFRPDIPPAIERLLAGALAPDPRDRFSDARSFIEACREAFDSVPRPKAGEASALKDLLCSLLPPGARSKHKLPSKVISLHPSLWDDTTVPDPPICAPATQEFSPFPVPSGPSPPRSPAVSPVTGTASRQPSGERKIPPRQPSPGYATKSAGKPRASPGLRKSHHLAWAVLVLLTAVASTLFLIHVYVMPLKVAMVYFRPALVILESAPSGAEVFVDGTRIPRNTPVAIEVQRDRAPHVVEFRKPGFVPAHRDLRYDREIELKVSVALLPASTPGPAP